MADHVSEYITLVEQVPHPILQGQFITRFSFGIEMRHARRFAVTVTADDRARLVDLGVRINPANSDGAAAVEQLIGALIRVNCAKSVTSIFCLP